MTWARFKFIDLFAGIGGIRIPFDKFNGKCVFSSEIDPYCQDAYEANFGERPHGDITKIAPEDVPDHDILLAISGLLRVRGRACGGENMKERPILFSAPMVRAILEGRKTQTRRIIKPQPDRHLDPDTVKAAWEAGYIDVKCTYGKPGDQLWVRETWQTWKEFDNVRPRDIGNQSDIQYPATYDGWDGRKRPSIYMPRWASRIQLEITGIRVERLNDISEADARAEGVLYVPGHGEISLQELHADPGFSNYLNCRMGFTELWGSINGPGSWAANPWVWVIEFRRIKP